LAIDRVDRHLAAEATDRNETCNVYVLKEEAMTDRSRRTDIAPSFSPALSDEGSSVRERAQATPTPVRKSDPNLSLDQRLVGKLAEAAAMLARLEPQDARARLLHIAMLRRDEALLDGILAELALPPVVRRSR
jgi:hypothetical protein